MYVASWPDSMLEDALTRSFGAIMKEPEDLFETISQTLLNAVDRDAFSGWGAIVHGCRTPDKILTRTLKGRMD